jgi:chromosome segregation ATPase
MSESMSKEARFAEWLRRLPHYLCLGDLVAGKRVLEVGCHTGKGAHFLANSGASQVIGVDSNPAAIEEAKARHLLENLTFRCERTSAIELDDESFDCIFVPEGLDVLRGGNLLAELRRLLAPEGYLVLSALSADRRTASGSGASYYEFQDRLAELFAPIRMLAQSAFVGVSLVEYGEDGAPEPELDLDTTLAQNGSGVEVSEYVAVCGGAPTALRGFTVVQLPSAEGIDAIAPLVGADLWERLRDAEDKAARALAHVGDLEAEAELRRRNPSGVSGGDLGRRLQVMASAQKRSATEIERLHQQLEEAQLELGRVVADAGIEIGKARGEVGALKKRTLELEADLARRLSTTSDENTVTRRIAEAMTAHQREMRALEDALDERQAWADELGDDLRAVRERLQEEQERGAEADTRLTRLSGELAEWRQKTAYSEGEILQLRGELADRPASGEDEREREGPALEAERSALDRSRQDLASARESLNEAQQTLDRERKGLEEEREKLKQSQRTLQEERDELAHARRTLDEERKGLEEEGEKIGQARRTLEQERKKLEEKERAVREVRNSMEEDRRADDEIRLEIEEARRALERARRNDEEARAQVERSRNELEQRQRELAAERRELEQRAGEFEGKQRAAEQLHGELEEKRGALEESLAQLERDRGELAELEQAGRELEKKRVEVERAHREWEAKRREMAAAGEQLEQARRTAEEERREADERQRSALEIERVALVEQRRQLEEERRAAEVSLRLTKRSAAAQRSVTIPFSATARQVQHLVCRVGEVEALLGELDAELRALRADATTTAVQRAPSLWAAQREEALRTLAEELGARDAELTLLNAGVAALRQRLSDVASAVKTARTNLASTAPEDLRQTLDRLGAKLDQFALP